MATGNRFEEAIRLLFSLEGEGEAAKAAELLREIGNAGEEAQQRSAGLLDEFADAQKLQAAIAGYRETGAKLVDLSSKIETAKRNIAQLTAEQEKTDKPSRTQQQAYQRAQRELSTLSEQYQSTLGKVQSFRTAITAAGLDVTKLADAEQAAAARLAAVRQGLAGLRDDTVAAAKATADQAQRLQEGDERYRAFMQSGRNAGQVLDQYRAKANAAADATQNAGAQAGTSSGLFGKLQGAVAGVISFLSIRSAITGVKNLLSLGDAAEETRKRLAGVFGAVEAKEAFSGLRRLADDFSLDFQKLIDSAVTLKRAGLDPLDGTLKALVAQNKAVGGSQDDLTAKTDLLAKAYTKQQLTTKDLVALTQAGLPVFDLLAAATGRSSEQIRLLADQGLLGRDAIAQLFGEIQKSAGNGGPKSLAGLVGDITDKVKDFFITVSDSGVLTFFKKQIADLGASIDAMARSGQLAALAKSTANGIITIANGVKAVTGFIVDHYQALLLIARGYATLKVAQWVVELTAVGNRWLGLAEAALKTAGAFDTTATRGMRLGAIIRAIPTAIKVGVVLVGAQLAIAGAKKLGQTLGENSEAAVNLSRVNEAVRAKAIQQAIAFEGLAKRYEKYRDEQVLTGEQIVALSDTERTAYQSRLQSLQNYLTAQNSALLRYQQLGTATAEQIEQQRQIALRLVDVRDGFNAITQAAELAARGLQTGISAQARGFADTLLGIEHNAHGAQQAIGKLFEGVDFAGENGKLGDIGLALSEVANQSAGADRVIRDGLLATLQQFSGEELLRFQSSATAAFDELKKSPAEVATVLDTTLLAAMERLGVQGERMGFAFTQGGRDAQAAFATVVENARATSAQVEAAFKSALTQSNTLDEVQALGAVMESAGRQGKLGFEATERAAAALRARIGEIQAIIDPLADSFGRLGIKSQSSLEAARDAAKDAFDQIVQGARDGIASQEDVQRAFDAYAETVRAAAKDSESWKQSTVEAQLATQAASLNLRDNLVKTGAAGADAGGRIARGARQASGALDQAASSADHAADSAGNLADNSGRVESAFRRQKSASDGLNASLGEGSIRFGQALMAANKYAGVSQEMFANSVNRTVGEQQKQSRAVQEQIAAIKAQNAEYDETEQRLQGLRQTYSFLGDDQLKALLDEQTKLDENIKRRDEAAKRQQEQQDQANASTERAIDLNNQLNTQDTAAAARDRTPAPVEPPVSRSSTNELIVTLQVRTTGVSSGEGLKLSSRDLDQVADAIVRRLGLAQTVSIRR